MKPVKIGDVSVSSIHEDCVEPIVKAGQALLVDDTYVLTGTLIIPTHFPGTTAGHIARATLESMAFQSADLVAAMESDSGTPLKELRVDGGACVNDALMQFQSDLLDVPVVRPRVSETTSLGAAYFAGLAVGFWKSQDEIAAQWSVDRRFTPRMDAATRQRLRAGWSRAVERTKGWALE